MAVVATVDCESVRGRFSRGRRWSKICSDDRGASPPSGTFSDGASVAGAGAGVDVSASSRGASGAGDDVSSPSSDADACSDSESESLSSSPPVLYGCVSRSSSSCSSMLLGFSTWSVCVGWGSVSAMVVHVREIRNSTLSSATMAEGATQGGNARQGRLVRAQCSTETGSELAKPRMVQHESQGCYVR